MYLFIFSGMDLWRPTYARGVYGGQVVGQALVAASKTTPSTTHCHSIHCCFMRAGMDVVSCEHCHIIDCTHCHTL